MKSQSTYVAKKPDEQGYVSYTDDEDQVWQLLYERQIKLMPHHACDEHIAGLKILDLPKDRVPQIPDVSKKLLAATGWQVKPVAALIPASEFFDLLAHKMFPVATFIRRMDELKYLKEPDIFHEIFGHCPMLTNPDFADYVNVYGKMVLASDEKIWNLLQRFFWFTVEFGLIQTNTGQRAYGGGILSSIEETTYSVESTIPERKPFIPLDIFRTPYRIDILQPIYYVINHYQQLNDFLKTDIASTIEQSRRLGEFQPKFPIHETIERKNSIC